MFKFLKQKKEIQNLDDVASGFSDLENKIKILSSRIEKLEKESKFFVQKVGIVRYNPFSNVGGDQSFSVALLDKDNNGVVITSLYAREENRTYAKPIEAGKSEYSLSNEEQNALDKAYGEK